MATVPVPDPPIRVLLVDDDRDDYLLTRELFAELPDDRFSLDWVADYELGLEEICRGVYDIFLLDYRLGEKTGIDLLKEAKVRGCSGPVILLTGQGGFAIDQEATEAGAADYLEKSRLDAAILERSIRYALTQKRYEASLESKVKERTEELAQANEALHEAVRRKDEFLATLAHELRNPLAPIRNALEIMRIAPDNPETVERARILVDRQVAHMVRLIDDLLDVSRITRGKLRLNVEQLFLSDVVAAAIEFSQPLIDQHSQTLVVKLPDYPINLMVDRMRFAQILANLLNNASKFTPTGGIVTLTAGQNGSHAEFVVTDTGEGIPTDVLPHIFDLFTQVDRTLSKSQGGLGIGLALVRRLTELHGGTVRANSDGVGRGATFTVCVPLPTA